MPTAVHSSVLNNGIQVLSEYMADVRSVSVGVLVGVGSRNEGDDERGYAHLIEHMLFQGTGERDACTIAEMMEIGGGAIGAFTTREYTVYHASVLDEYLPFALDALGDMLCNSVLPERALERQRKVILNEIAGHVDPLRRTNELLKSTIWPNDPLGHPTSGTEDSIRAATREQIIHFMRRHYTSDNVIIAAAGSIDHNHLVSQVQDAFWQLKPGPLSRVVSAPETNLGRLVAESRDLEQVVFSLAWPAPAYINPERYAWHVLAHLYGASPTSRLYRRLREEQGMVYHIDAQYQAYQDIGALVVEGATLPETLIPVLANVLFELFQLSQEPVGLDDHFRAVQALISQHFVSGDSPYVRMSRLALQKFYFDRVVGSQEVEDALRAQSIDAVQNAAQTALSHGLPTVALVGPVTEALLEEVSALLGDLGEAPVIELLPDRATALSVPA